MLKVMIVDDEFIVRDDMKNLINWEQNGCKIVAEAANGRFGLEYYHQYHPDIVFTDIRMPVCDGFTMVEEITRTDSACEFILLTGYDDFEYARRAMSLQLNTYLLKHELNEQNLLAVIDQAKNRLETRRFRQNLVQGNLFREILTNKVDQNELESLQQTGFLQVHDGVSCLLVFEDNQPCLADLLRGSCAALDRVRVYTVIDFERLCIAIVKISALGQSEGKYLTDQLLQAICADVSPEESCPIRVAVSRRIHDLSQLQSAFDHARDCLRRLLLSDGRLNVIYAGTWVPEPIPEGTVQANLTQISQLLDDYRYVDAEEACLSFLQECVRKKDLEAYFHWKENLLRLLSDHDALNDYGQNAIIQQLKAELSSGECSAVLGSILLKFDSRNAGSNTRKVRKIVRYMEENYRKDLSLQDIAGLLYLNEIYAGQLFKKEMGITFKKYLTQLRISKAVELLQSGEYKIYEVGELVGYQSLPYFCSKFKQVTGKNPSDYL